MVYEPRIERSTRVKHGRARVSQGLRSLDVLHMLTKGRVSLLYMPHHLSLDAPGGGGTPGWTRELPEAGPDSGDDKRAKVCGLETGRGGCVGHSAVIIIDGLPEEFRLDSAGSMQVFSQSQAAGVPKQKWVGGRALEEGG